MRVLPRPHLLSLVLVAAAGAAQGEDLASGLAKCRSVKDSLERLVCYDALAKEAGGETQGSTATAAEPARSAPRPSSSAAAPRSAPASTRCLATTKKGAQCSRTAKAGSSYCWQHGG
jgi:hypothetical protein